MTSQIESIRLTQYIPLYENEQFERRISQWRLQKAISLHHLEGRVEKRIVQNNTNNDKIEKLALVAKQSQSPCFKFK